MTMNMPNYALEYNERLDALASLELLAESLPKVLITPHYWKWVILSLHSALQGFMVLSLQGTNFLGVLSSKSAREWLDAYEGSSTPQNPLKLDAFLNLYSKVKSDTILIWANSKAFEPSSSQDASVNKLNAFRNDFIHYIPAEALLDMRVWARLVLDVVPIIEFLAFESNNIRFDEDAIRQKVKGLCEIAKGQASAILMHYGA
jgi:hypothetical protein